MIPKAIPLRSEEMFRLALRHTSAAPNTIADSYERLEFFGDSVLGLVIAQYLYEHHSDWDQGMLSKAKSSVVQERPLAEVAGRLGLAPYLELSPNEEAAGGRKRASILADVVEALIGAVYLESGMEVARWFVLEQLQGELMRISTGDVAPDDYKSKLQEISQQVWRKTPIYKVIREMGNAHDRRFLVQVSLDDEVIGEGMGKSKKEAEQASAADAISIIESHQKFTRRTVDFFEELDR
jgi:ribonuclease-3